MGNLLGSETQIVGGGYGGFGGWGGLGGLSPFGLFGALPLGGLGGYGSNCGCPQPVYDICGRHGGHNCDCHKHNDTKDFVSHESHYHSLQDAIGQVRTDMSAGFNNTTAQITNLGYNTLIGQKDIIREIDTKFCAVDKDILNTKFELSKQISDCCCLTQKSIADSTATIIERFNKNEIQELRDRLHRSERDNDFFRVSANFRANTVGSNFNTGVQTQSTSNNSGQIVG